MQRYFLNKVYENQETIEVSGDVYHHMIRVMRMTEEDQVYLAFLNQVIVAKIQKVGPETVELIQMGTEEQQKELPVRVTIASGYPKGDKLDLIFQKATELGAFGLEAFPAAASVVKWDHKKRQKKQERLQKIALEAAEQSHRSYCPTVRLYEQQQELIATFSQYTYVLVAYEESAKQNEKGKFVQTLTNLKQEDSLLLLFGPEGGFSPKEIASFEAAGAQCCGLGPRILRAETAPFYALSAISYQTELMASLNV